MTTDQWFALVWVMVCFGFGPMAYVQAREYYRHRKPWFYKESAIVWVVYGFYMVPFIAWMFRMINKKDAQS